MNVENILKVADAIERHEIKGLGFNMATFKDVASEKIPDLTGTACGTVACIAGWTDAIRGGVDYFVDDGFVPDRAQAYLGLGHAQADDLFYAWNDDTIDFANITPEVAVRTLRKLAETGVVNWGE